MLALCMLPRVNGV